MGKSRRATGFLFLICHGFTTSELSYVGDARAVRAQCRDGVDRKRLREFIRESEVGDVLWARDTEGDTLHIVRLGVVWL